MKNIDKVKYRCKICGDILTPDGRGSMIWCSCNKVAVDGRYDASGEGYCRVIGNADDYEQVIE